MRTDIMNITKTLTFAYLIVVSSFICVAASSEETPQKFHSAWEDDPILGKALASGDIATLIGALHEENNGFKAAELIFELPIEKQVPIWRDWLRDDKLWPREMNSYYRFRLFRCQVWMQMTLSQFFKEKISFSNVLTDTQRHALIKRIDEALPDKPNAMH